MKQTNRQFAGFDEEFRDACRLANVAPTRRQASKFRRSEGLAFKASRFAQMNTVGDEDDLFSRLEFAGLRLSQRRGPTEKGVKPGKRE